MKNINEAYDTIISPIITEKSTNLGALNKLSFKVSQNANKSKIKKSIEAIYKVNVIKINTVNFKGKYKFVRGRLAKGAGYKKAIVTLKEGQTIDLSAGI